MRDCNATITTPSIHVVGIGLEGATGLAEAVRSLVFQAQVLVGSPRHLSYFADYPGQSIVLGKLPETIKQIQQVIDQAGTQTEPATIVILASGDPLFFGLGRVLLENFPRDWLTFHPHLSSVQLAFSRVKLPWQDAQIISAHGRSLAELTQALQKGSTKLAVLTDAVNTPRAIVELIRSLELPIAYRGWVCENLGGAHERILDLSFDAEHNQSPSEEFAALNVVILQRQETTCSLDDLTLAQLPLFGIPDHYFLSFPDRPGLITKREIRVQILAELALQPQQTVWDIGAGTGSVSIEVGRLVPDGKIYAIEKTAIGVTLIQQNCHRFDVQNVQAIAGVAPEVLTSLPNPDRIFIGGSGGRLDCLLEYCLHRLKPNGRIILALATLEHQLQAFEYLKTRSECSVNLLQVNISRAAEVAHLTRWAPLNPVTLMRISRET